MPMYVQSRLTLSARRPFRILAEGAQLIRRGPCSTYAKNQSGARGILYTDRATPPQVAADADAIGTYLPPASGRNRRAID